MSDPFANLLSSFKGDTPNSTSASISKNASLDVLASQRRAQSDLSSLSAKLTPSLKTNSDTQRVLNTTHTNSSPIYTSNIISTSTATTSASINITSNSNATTTTSNRSKSTLDDFEDLFGKIDQRQALRTEKIPSTAPDSMDELDRAMNTFNSNTPSVTKNGSKSNYFPPMTTEKNTSLLEGFDDKPTIDTHNNTQNSNIQLPLSDDNLDMEDQQSVVDEVKDMEIAKLMSLGLSIDKAHMYYNKGYLSDDVLRKMQAQKHKRQSNYSTKYDDTKIRNSLDKLNNSASPPGNNVLFSIASDFLNKGKGIVDQFSTYHEEDYRPFRSTNFSSRNNSIHSEKHKSPDTTPISVYENDHAPLTEYENGKVPILRRKEVKDTKNNEKLSKNGYPSRSNRKFMDATQYTTDYSTTEGKNYSKRDSNVRVSSPVPSSTSGTSLSSRFSPNTLNIVQTQTSPISLPHTNVIEGDLLGDFGSNLKNHNESLVSHGSQESSILFDFDSDSVTSMHIKQNNSATSKNIVTAKADEKDLVNTLPIVKVPISTIELSGYTEFRANGTEFFKKGDYDSALSEYKKSLNTLPQKHPLRLISYSNILAAQLKVGEYSQSVKDCDVALELFPKNDKQWTQFIQDSDPQKTYKEIWPKIVLRKAEACEHMEKYQIAYDSYQLLLHKNVFNDKIMAGKRRCQKVLNPETPKLKSSANTSRISSAKQSTASTSSINVNKNVERLKETRKKEREEEEERLRLLDSVNAKIQKWTNNKEDDIRYLLSNVHIVLTWSNWKAINASDLVMPKKVKVNYMKAVAKTHPDKISKDLSIENKMIAESIFSILSVAWEKFKTANKMNS
ncbi:hypothetical protein TBLA_0H01970 [Henningerozyma blattae CBS 6284]|uniref:SWA2-like ubiquitin-associated domain-containing protein n=1 Tax=Henningerozyma blattae (strain ATCC 34711 / CBS 6284 / DSM 70876 / NBRC 10599 / NRRL Y-10934 / UCD 77-7) TaxID=1071380 RepID=I2H7Y1_HENB6|nr:hypothetical protein TBLA_0H01970 [Tetrapisispora blattae CBS 6284]CCH62483.1 hypothetical protein TBLA_0H01970 [Tetrapisispora blattae CBS 6284]